MIVKRIYTCAAPKFNYFFKRYKISSECYEKIWTLFKFLISDYFELLADKSLDFLIVLTLFITTYMIDKKFNLFENQISGKIYFI
jgi:hypothetical protein